MNPMVSVVMPVYNSAAFLAQSVGTVLGQSMTDFELILVDDGSTDDSLERLKSYQDTRVKVLTQQNQGAGVARNLGMSHARGKYILFLDSDDYFSPDMLAVLTQKAEQTGADVTICRATCFDHQTGGELPSEWLRKDGFLARLEGRDRFEPAEMHDCLFQFTYGWAWDKLFRLEFVREEKLVFPNFPTSHDLCFVYPALVCCKTIAVTHQQLVFYRMNRHGSVSDTRSEHLQAPFQAISFLEDWLQKRNRFEEYKRSFLNFVVSFLVWHVSSVHPKSAQKVGYAQLKEVLGTRYQLSRIPKGYFAERSIYYKCRLVQFAPFCLYSAVLQLWKRRQ